MTKINDLTQGSISKGIWSMAIPLITASFVQMAYNMTDMIWLGHLGSESVAAVGVAGFFTWLGNALSFISKVGAHDFPIPGGTCRQKGPGIRQSISHAVNHHCLGIRLLYLYRSPHAGRVISSGREHLGIGHHVYAPGHPRPVLHVQ